MTLSDYYSDVYSLSDSGHDRIQDHDNEHDYDDNFNYTRVPVVYKVDIGTNTERKSVFNGLINFIRKYKESKLKKNEKKTKK